MSNEFINIGSANSSPEQFQLRYISISKYEGDWQSDRKSTRLNSSHSSQSRMPSSA